MYNYYSLPTATQAHLRPNTINIPAKDGEGCPRCGGAVFAAELMLAKGRSWHKSCFKCKTCNKSLDSTSHCDGPDRDIYCKGIHALTSLNHLMCLGFPKNVWKP